MPKTRGSILSRDGWIYYSPRTMMTTMPGATRWLTSHKIPRRRWRSQNESSLNHIADGDEEWDDFEDSTSPKNAAPAPHLPSISTHTTPAHPSKPLGPPNSQTSSPPTNIPPPSLLLSIFPSLLASAQETLFDPLTRLHVTQRHTLLTHPATLKFLRAYLHQAIVLGHIIAGRKLRWKRDQHLSQSMRMGPSGGGGGMKLAGVDRSEVAKEEREVLDVVRLWRDQVGKLRTAVAGVGAVTTLSDEGKLRAVPEVAEQMPIRTLKASEGGLTAPHACALCGLRREERVSKVDVDVEDSFGEWWLDGPQMHLVCRDFWEEYKGRLKSR
ncbi:hypothetical protein BAUCODRAFT_177187 [Baudoinia panamericana UAMH 10762]|uniref:Uncharacterized protein n=1 Tax=Baudoinia panamericana (strain UAMH 10762) TaxID=717646 RepID=M2M0T5_BAUPA|nr:uncharacterized protein BAUCODRAFT_177187 [Baudoinia panamericana UAMH 10762]EMD00633.1 hypothetical protein BAUCODRAFT_177187 [Baudoinia panamericana UAMH 10762]